MRIALVFVALCACTSSDPRPGGAIELSGSTTGTFERDPTSLTCEPTYVIARYFSASKELLLITFYVNSVKDGRVRISFDDAKNTYSLVESAAVEISKHGDKTAYKLTFDPAKEFRQSDFANANPHSPGGAERRVTARGTTTIVCSKT